jgi:hypothetical protein
MRLKEGMLVTVDGYAGEIIAHAESTPSGTMI